MLFIHITFQISTIISRICAIMYAQDRDSELVFRFRSRRLSRVSVSKTGTDIVCTIKFRCRMVVCSIVAIVSNAVQHCRDEVAPRQILTGFFDEQEAKMVGI